LKTTTPNPGSDEAVKAGCTCPVMDNNHGAGCGWGKGKFWRNVGCPIHNSPKKGLAAKRRKTRKK
jgi:hypothetical protein